MRGNFSRTRPAYRSRSSARPCKLRPRGRRSRIKRLELFRAGAAHGHARAIVEHDVEGLDVVGDLAAQQAVHAATVVADHAAQRAARVSSRIGRVGQVMQFGSLAQAVEDNARFDLRQLGARIN